jgi:hypothetical protein
VSEEGVARVNWTVDARKLKVKDKVAVSPPFELRNEKNSAADIPGTFRLMLHPKAVTERKGGGSFRKAKGKGTITVKCESPDGLIYDGAVAVKISVGNGSDDDTEPPRGPMQHNFAESSIFSLPCDQDEWDFDRAKNEETSTFVVCLEVTCA